MAIEDMRPRRNRVRYLFWLFAVWMNALLAEASDLRVDQGALRSSLGVSEEVIPPESCTLVESCVRAPGLRRLLRFDTTVNNEGASDLVVGEPTDQNSRFEFSACHEHYHLRDFIIYELLDAASRQPIRIDGSAVLSRKMAFCLQDSFKVGEGPTFTGGKFDCDFQGISAGSADEYSRDLDCQWLDITGVPAGRYILRLTLDPDFLLPDLDRSNNVTEVPIELQSLLQR